MDNAPERRPMDLPLLASIVVAGGLIGLLSSLGTIPGSLELVAWLIVGTAAIIAALRRIPQDAFRHLTFGFMVGGFLGANVKALLWERFLANHQDLVQETMAEGVESISRTAVVISDTLTGVILGLVFGGVATYVVRRGAARPTVAADEEE